MKLGTTLFLVILIAFAFTAIGLVVTDMGSYYPEVVIDTSYMGRFNYVTQVNESMGDIATDLTNIANEQSGWTRLLGGILVFFKGVFTTIGVILLSIPFLGAIATGVGSDLGIPAIIIAFAVLGITASAIIMLIKFINKNQI